MKGGRDIASALSSDQHYIVDAITDHDLVQIGQACKGLPLVCGGSGIALGLPANFNISPGQPGWPAVSGPGAVISGSCSRATRAQVNQYLLSAPAFQIEAKEAVEGHYDIDEIANWVMKQAIPPLIYSSADPNVVRDAQQQFGTKRAADAIETLFANLAAQLVERGLRRLVVAGGETSGAVVEGLNARELTIGPRAAVGVPLVTFNGIGLALKSGNFGGPTFFEDTLVQMETGQ